MVHKKDLNSLRNWLIAYYVVIALMTVIAGHYVVILVWSPPIIFLTYAYIAGSRKYKQQVK